MNARAIAFGKLIAIDSVYAKALSREGRRPKMSAKKAEGLQFNVEEIQSQEPVHKVILDDPVKMGFNLRRKAYSMHLLVHTLQLLVVRSQFLMLNLKLLRFKLLIFLMNLTSVILVYHMMLLVVCQGCFSDPIQDLSTMSISFRFLT